MKLLSEFLQRSTVLIAGCGVKSFLGIGNACMQIAHQEIRCAYIRMCASFLLPPAMVLYPFMAPPLEAIFIDCILLSCNQPSNPF